MDTLLNLFPELQLAGIEVQLAVLRCINQTKFAELEHRNAAFETGACQHPKRESPEVYAPHGPGGAAWDRWNRGRV